MLSLFLVMMKQKKFQVCDDKGDIMSQLNDPAIRKAVYSAIREISGSMTRVEAERDFMKDATKNICEQYEIPKKAFRKLVKVYHKQNFNQEKEEHLEFEHLYETITNTTAMANNNEE